MGAVILLVLLYIAYISSVALLVYKDMRASAKKYGINTFVGIFHSEHRIQAVNQQQQRQHQQRWALHPQNDALTNHTPNEVTSCDMIMIL